MADVSLKHQLPVLLSRQFSNSRRRYRSGVTWWVVVVVHFLLLLSFKCNSQWGVKGLQFCPQVRWSQVKKKKNDEDKNVLIFFLYFHSGEHKEVKLSSLFGQIRVILNSVSAGRGETNCVIGMWHEDNSMSLKKFSFRFVFFVVCGAYMYIFNIPELSQ